MKKKILATLLVSAICFAGCGTSTDTQTETDVQSTAVEETQSVSENAEEASTEAESGPLSMEEVLEYGYMAYDDIISEMVNEFNENWTYEPETLGVSYIYGYNSPYFGFARLDINGDGIDELLIGEAFSSEDAFMIYDLFTIDVDASLIHLFCGGERDIMYISGDILYEEGSSGADDNFVKAYKLENGALVEAEVDMTDVTYDAISFDLFSNYTSVE